ncbi:MAG: transglycosylase domain-containing protein [Chitinophagales bacterium]
MKTKVLFPNPNHPNNNNNNSSNKPSSSKKEKWQKVAMIAGIALLSGLLLFFIFFLSVLWGAFGKLPSESELSDIKNPLSSEVYAADGKLLGKYYIENRSYVPYNLISPNIINALVATEDARYFKHKGVDTKSYLRVLFKTILMGNESAGGGSTISQQLIKNLYGRENHGIFTIPVSKIKEAIIAVRLEKQYSKQDVLALYLNTVSFGERAFGIGTATERFFSTTPKDIQLEEAATLIGMLKATTAYSPRRNPEKSKGRRDVVLGLMAKEGYITDAEKKAAQQKPLTLKYNRLTQNDGLAPYFRQYLKEELKEWCKTQTKADGTPYNLFTDGLKIYTSIDSKMQEYAEKAVSEHLAELQKIFDKQWKPPYPWTRNPSMLDDYIKRSERYKMNEKAGTSQLMIDRDFRKPREMEVFSWEGKVDKTMNAKDSILYYLPFLQAGFMAMDPVNGEVKAWVGGINHEYFQLDHVTNPRQVGSTFKPIVYATAIEKGISPCNYYQNELRTYVDYDNWTPRNSDNKYGGYYTMKGALANSVNTVSVQILLQMGVDTIINNAHKMGIESELPAYPSIALGTPEITLKEMVSAYSVFANGGYERKPTYLVSIKDKNNRLLEKFSKPYYQDRKRALSAETAYTMAHIMEGVIDSGTARRLRWQFNLQNDIAGKTGTTQDQVDGWFIGYTPKLVAGAWVGAEDRRIHFKSIEDGQGARTALPIWGKFFKSLADDKNYKQYVASSFTQPSEETLANLDCEFFVDVLPTVEPPVVIEEPKPTSPSPPITPPTTQPQPNKPVNPPDGNRPKTRTRVRVN